MVIVRPNLSSDWLLISPVREVGVALGPGVAEVADEEIRPGPEDWAAALVVRHSKQALLDVKLAHVRTWSIRYGQESGHSSG